MLIFYHLKLDFRLLMAVYAEKNSNKFALLRKNKINIFHIFDLFCKAILTTDLR